MQCLVLLGLIAACSGDEGQDRRDADVDFSGDLPDGPDADADALVPDADADALVPDADADAVLEDLDAVPPDSDDPLDDSAEDCQTADVPPDQEPGEFSIRIPQGRTVTCEDWEGNPYQETFYDQDMMCLVEYDCVSAEVYLQATPTGCISTGFPYPSFDAEHTSAWIRIDGEISESAATYGYGGNHHNDWFTFEFEGQTYRMSHSSIGCGGRACQPPDCLQICNAEGPCESAADVAVNGCERGTGDGPPPSPQVCVYIDLDGSVPPLLDPWVEHDENEDYPVLPCACDFPGH